MVTYQKKYNTVWDKVSTDVKIEFGNEPVYNKHLKTKTRSHGDEITGFYNKKIPSLDSNHTCLAVISLDSALKKDENYYPQVLLKQCKYNEKKVVRHIHDNLSNVSSSDECDQEYIFYDKHLSWLLLAYY